MEFKEEIVGKRIVLKKIIASFDFAKVVFKSIDESRDLFRPWLGWVDFTNKPEDCYDFSYAAQQKWKEKTEFSYEIFKDDIFIGIISALNIKESYKRAEIGYWLNVNHNGFGYMTEAVGLLEKELFENGFNKLIIHTDVLNLASASVAKRAGYSLEAILKQHVFSSVNNRYRDQNVFVKFKLD